MYSYNRVHIIGYQTQPVDLRQTPGGTSVTDLNLVTPYSFTGDNGEKIQGKGFHTVTLWGPMADIANQFVRAGSQLFISGRLQTDTWEDQQTNERRSKTKIVALDMILLDPRDGQLPAPEGASLPSSGTALTVSTSSATSPVILNCAPPGPASRFSHSVLPPMTAGKINLPVKTAKGASSTTSWCGATSRAR
ncbi:MAG: Single-stranded DNA-binding protein [Candidatus Peribacteria bacterium GW2011_GWB1_54_5]|nr:MAG: Single-stranded DNA-binding protein [Candidatus Peribacteria bacterium GW2011_GWB1_54_5]